MKKNFLILCRGLFIAAAMMTGFAACSDDDEEIINNDDEEITEWVRPTEDVIQNHIDLKTVVYGSFDEVTERVIARITSPQIGNTARTEFIPEDAQLVIMDNNTMLDLSKEQIDALHDAYQRGTICYLHKPNAFGAALFYAAMEMGSDALLATTKSQTRADDDSWLYPYDVVMMHKEKGVCQLADAYSSEPYTRTSVVDKIDVETEEIISSKQEEKVYYQMEPNTYEYGQLAEELADWINDPEKAKSAITRTESKNVLDEVPGKVVIPIYFEDCSKWNNSRLSHPAILYYWISSLYNFDADQDYYHVILQEEYDASQGYRGKYAQRNNTWGAYDTKYLGQAYNGPHVYAWMPDYGFKVEQWNEQPMIDGKITDTETVKGWSIGASIGYSSGFMGSLSPTYSSSTKVSALEKEMKVIFNKDQSLVIRDPHEIWPDITADNAMEWEYDYGAKSCMGFSKGPQPQVKKTPSEYALCRNISRPMQSWNWILTDTKKKNASYFECRVNVVFPVISTIGTPTGGKIDQTNMKNEVQHLAHIQLPSVNRYKHTYSLMHGTINDLEEWNRLYPILTQGSTAFAAFANHESRCGRSEDALEEKIAAEWNEIADKLKGLELPRLENTYRIRLKDENNRVCGKTLVIDKNSIRME